MIFILSDGTGVTAEHALRAALTQFADIEVGLERRAEIRTEPQAREVLEEAAAVGGLVVHTVVSKDLRKSIVRLSRLFEVETIDLMGPLLARLAEQLATSPSEKPGLFRELNQHYFERIEAMEFALRHDDGRHVDELEKAELVLVGVSRTFKTPLSIYFAFRGWLVANVPIVLDMPVPQILYELPPERVFGLTTTARRLATLRCVRKEHLGGAVGRYAELSYVRRELTYSSQIFARQSQWRVIQVTDKPIEEIASEILADLRKKSPPG